MRAVEVVRIEKIINAKIVIVRVFVIATKRMHPRNVRNNNRVDHVIAEIAQEANRIRKQKVEKEIEIENQERKNPETRNERIIAVRIIMTGIKEINPKIVKRIKKLKTSKIKTEIIPVVVRKIDLYLDLLGVDLQ